MKKDAGVEKIVIFGIYPHQRNIDGEMPLSIIKEQYTDTALWDAAARACPYATFFHSSHWAAVFCEYTGNAMEPSGRLITFSDRKTAVLTLCRQKKAGILTSFVSSPAGTYGGWVSADELGEEHTRLLAKRLAAFGNIEWRENPFDPVLRTVEIPASVDDFTQTADLRNGFEAAYARWSRCHVRSKKKAHGFGVTVRQASDINDWKRHYECYRWLRRRWVKATSDYRWRLFKLLYDAQSPHIILWLAERGDKLLSSVVCFYWNKHAVAWHGAASPEDFAIRANHLMYYEIMKDAAQNGYHWFDMNPSGGNQGVVEFKAHMGMSKIRSRIIIRRKGLLRILGKCKKILSYIPQVGWMRIRAWKLA